MIDGRCRNRSTRGDTASRSRQTPSPHALACTSSGRAATLASLRLVRGLRARPTVTCSALAGTSNSSVSPAKAARAPKTAGLAERATSTR